MADVGYSKKKLSPLTSIVMSTITKQGEYLEDASYVGLTEYSVSNQYAYGDIPRSIRIGGIIGDSDWSGGMTNAITTKTEMRAGKTYLVITGFDGSSANYDKYTLAYKAATEERISNDSRCMAIDLDNGNASRRGEYVSNHMDCNGTPTTGYDFRYSFGTDGNLYITPDYLAGTTLGMKLKLFYITHGSGVE